MNFRQNIKYVARELQFVVNTKFSQLPINLGWEKSLLLLRKYNADKVTIFTSAIFCLGWLIAIIQPRIPPLPHTIWHPGWESYRAAFTLPTSLGIFLSVWLVIFIIAGIIMLIAKINFGKLGPAIADALVEFFWKFLETLGIKRPPPG